jgi:hypothetical protein
MDNLGLLTISNRVRVDKISLINDKISETEMQLGDLPTVSKAKHAKS